MVTITTFFSYKGGAGRSTTCLNTIPFLAEESEAHAQTPILLMDMDIESAGMTYLLNQQDVFKGKYDVKEFLKGEETWSSASVSDLKSHPLYKKFVPVGSLLGLSENDAVLFLGVDDSSAQLDRSDVAGKIEEMMNRLQRFAANNNFRAIVLDSAAGDQFSARLAVDSSDKIVFCMRPTRQFRVGTFNYLRRLDIKYGKAGDEKEIILLPTVVPKDAVISGDSQLQTSVDDIKKRISTIENLDIISDFVKVDKFGINEITRFKWQEGVLYKLKKEETITPDEEEGLKRYKKLAQLICE